MREISDEVCARLDRAGIPYERVRHEASASMEECAALDEKLSCVTVKNVFLTTKNHKRFYLCLTRPEARFKTSDISKQVSSSRLSFGEKEEMEKFLRVTPGSVSPLGLLFDEEKAVTLLADSALRRIPRLGFHPCDNRETLVLTNEAFFDCFLPALGREARDVEIHDFLSE